MLETRRPFFSAAREDFLSLFSALRDQHHVKPMAMVAFAELILCSVVAHVWSESDAVEFGPLGRWPSLPICPSPPCARASVHGSTLHICVLPVLSALRKQRSTRLVWFGNCHSSDM